MRSLSAKEKREEEEGMKTKKEEEEARRKALILGSVVGAQGSVGVSRGAGMAPAAAPSDRLCPPRRPTGEHRTSSSAGSRDRGSGTGDR